MVERYPFFVYGTLIPGQPNDYLWEDCIEKAEQGVLVGGRLFDMGSFPMLIDGGWETVAGKLMFPYKELPDEDYQLLVQRLDTLENYDPENVEDSPYYRVLRSVLVGNDKPITAWVYLGRPQYTDRRPLITNGNWIEYSANVHSHIATWWEEHGQGLLFSKAANNAGGKD
jgi:gamma-glutamylcyclotransferase (GGCT)/AIG2-like uncharacterized protein YtfP